MASETMTLDELITGLEGVYGNFVYSGVEDAMMKYIKANREALEAGMRGTLRFRIKDKNPPINEYRWEFILLASDGKELRHMGAYRQKDGGMREMRTFTQSIGLTTVFEGDSDG